MPQFAEAIEITGRGLGLGREREGKVLGHVPPGLVDLTPQAGRLRGIGGRLEHQMHLHFHRTGQLGFALRVTQYLVADVTPYDYRHTHTRAHTIAVTLLREATLITHTV